MTCLFSWMHTPRRRGENATNQDIIERYLAVCPDSAYDAIVQTASAYLDQLAANEQERVRQDLLAQMRQADETQEKKTAAWIRLQRKNIHMFPFPNDFNVLTI